MTFKAGEVHRFWNAGEDELHCAAYIEPADDIEYFLEQLFASAKRNGGARPHPMDAAFLARRYRSAFALQAIPALAQRLVVPVLVFLGALLGRHARYADAPEPVRR